MQPISLVWTPMDNGRFSAQFFMPPNDQCSTWWLEVEPPLQAEVWVNGLVVGSLEPEVSMLEVTAAVVMGENTLTLVLQGQPIESERCQVVPYPCA